MTAHGKQNESTRFYSRLLRDYKGVRMEADTPKHARRNVIDILVVVVLMASLPYLLGLLAKMFWKAFLWGWTVL